MGTNSGFLYSWSGNQCLFLSEDWVFVSRVTTEQWFCRSICWIVRDIPSTTGPVKKSHHILQTLIWHLRAQHRNSASNWLSHLMVKSFSQYFAQSLKTFFSGDKTFPLILCTDGEDSRLTVNVLKSITQSHRLSLPDLWLIFWDYIFLSIIDYKLEFIIVSNVYRIEWKVLTLTLNLSLILRKVINILFKTIH